MRLRPRKLTSALLGPVPVSRGRALAVSERLAAVNAVTASLEHLSQRRNIQQGGLNDWSIERDLSSGSTPLTRRLLDAVSGERATLALHGARVAAGAALLLPGCGRWRGAANGFLGLSNVALYPRHRFGTDGADQVATLVQTATGLARMSRREETQDALLWYVALQANLSYLVSGWVKLLGREWRDGTAMSGVMRTRTYGHEGLWKLTRTHPVPARFLAHGVLALECLFPLAYAKGGALAKPIIGGAAAFHTANGFVMGLGRFLTAFTSMHPMVAYTSTPRNHPAVAGRDDRILTAALATGAAAVTGAAAIAASRRSRVADAPSNSRAVVTRHGNRLTYNARLTAGRKGPVVVFVNGMTSTVEHFGWITEQLVEDGELDLLTYDRAGYAASSYRGGSHYSLRESVEDLADLVRGAVPADREVVLAGHSLGGELARQAAAELGGRVRGVVYLDSSHPAELRRSAQQNKSAGTLRENLSQFTVSLRAGLGALLARPEWVDNLPRRHRSRAFAQYADARMWRASVREWTAAEREFSTYEGELDRLPTAALVLSAQQTVDRDPEHLLLHRELADAHRGSGRLVRTEVLEGADHDSMLTDPRLGTETARRILDFLAALDTRATGDADGTTHSTVTAQEER
ncbi:alpha/beta fold hydrolase [Streptomyces sp. AJS327]|uniref:alpha/beta fold hydrolase n=1 Tax=Streptomyces sp. AJS327 TaxID=2545265 RepID=UPI0015DEBD4C|nr:alpha/beta fold hydrolase [Streptomyces sp. AJS327]MBA0053543.1 alpha/beta fold hydrolase [Streptomyces sp. AJS327]